jgi:hypothetical protein
MSTTTLTGRKNLTKFSFWLGPVGPTEKENQTKMYKKYLLFKVQYLFETARIRIRIKQSDPDQIENQDPDPFQSEQQDPDPHHKCSVPWERGVPGP